MVRTSQLFRFAKAAALPRRADRMEDILCRQPECRGTHRPAQIAVPYGFTGGGQLLLPCRLIDGTAGAAALQKVPVGGVDDGIRCYLGDVVADHQKRHGSSSLTWFSSSYHILQSGARTALILLFTQLWQRAGRKRPECRIKDSVLPPCRKVHREPFQLLCKNHQPFPQMVVMWSIYMGNKTVGAIKKNAVHDLSVCPQLPMAMSTSTTTTAMAMRQPQPLPSPPPPPPLL